MSIDEYNVVQIVAAGRACWKVENENNNVLKNHGYHFDHNFAHGKRHLSNFLATLNLLAFLAHTALEWLDEALPRRPKFDTLQADFLRKLAYSASVYPF